MRDENLDLPTEHNNLALGELLIYITRHTQHHAAQLGLRVQQITGQELKWIRAGWKV
jgi:hypothetical protein